MSQHNIKTQWVKSGEFSHKEVKRNHQVNFNKNINLDVSGANATDAADPEQLLAASVSSCHMQTFLLLAAKKRLIVESYTDNATAELNQRDDGKFWVSKITLNPLVVFSGDKIIDHETFINMHNKSHDHCFVANSLSCEVVVLPKISLASYKGSPQTEPL